MTILLAFLIGPIMFAQQIDGGSLPVATAEESVGKTHQKYIPTEDNLRYREQFNDYRFGVFIH